MVKVYTSVLRCPGYLCALYTKIDIYHHTFHVSGHVHRIHAQQISCSNGKEFCELKGVNGLLRKYRQGLVCLYRSAGNIYNVMSVIEVCDIMSSSKGIIPCPITFSVDVSLSVMITVLVSGGYNMQ